MQFPGKSRSKDLIYSARRVLLPWRNAQRAVILAYHSVGYAKDQFTITPEAFAWQLKELQREGCSVVSVNELDRMMGEGSIHPRTVVITFDDGRKDNYEHVFPLIQKYKVPISIFLVTGSIGTRLPDTVSDSEALTETEIRDMDASGWVTFGAHTVSHPKLTQISEEDVKREVTESKVAVEKLLSKSCDYLAYPYGRVSASVEVAAKHAGFALALATEAGVVTPDSPRYRLPRNGIDANTSHAAFKGILAHGSL
jgi:peptidoglycan/xylan/chitin deacetylase (PgdA/CDA1 family)